MTPPTVPTKRSFSKANQSQLLLIAMALFTFPGQASSKVSAPQDVEQLERARTAAKSGRYVECFNGICMVADDNHPQAYSVLGHMYEDGVGVEKSMGKAISFYEKAANKGIPDAECRLGHIYYHGHGVPKDSHKACKWLTRAANHNMAEAQNTLGHMYLIGDGVKKDAQLAAQWLRKAAANGIKEAAQAIDDLPPVKPITNDSPAGQAFEQGMGNLEHAWQGYADIVQSLHQSTGN